MMTCSTQQPVRPSLAFKHALQQMEPWQFGLYGMPSSIQRKYDSSSSLCRKSQTYETNRLALADLFYGLVTGTSPYIGDIRNMGSLFDRTSSLSLTSGHNSNIQIMYKVHYNTSPDDFTTTTRATEWMPLRMGGPMDDCESLDPMSKCCAKDIITRVKGRSMGYGADAFFRFLGEVKKVSGDRLVPRHALSDDVSGKVDGPTGCLSPSSPFASIRVISFPHTERKNEYAHIMLVTGVNRGKKYGSLGDTHIKHDRRKASEFVHVLSRYHVAGNSSCTRASSAHSKDVTLSGLWTSAVSTLVDGGEELPDVIPGSMTVNNVSVEYVGKVQGLMCAYSIDANIGFIDTTGKSNTSSILITMAVVNASLPPSTVAAATTSTTIRAKQPIKMGKGINASKPHNNRDAFKQLLGWCKPISSYVVHRSLTLVATNDAKNGSPWAQAFIAMVKGDKETAIQVCEGIRNIIDRHYATKVSDAKTQALRDRLELRMQDRADTASILHHVSEKFGVANVIPLVARDVGLFM